MNGSILEKNITIYIKKIIIIIKEEQSNTLISVSHICRSIEIMVGHIAIHPLIYKARECGDKKIGNFQGENSLYASWFYFKEFTQ